MPYVNQKVVSGQVAQTQDLLGCRLENTGAKEVLIRYILSLEASPLEIVIDRKYCMQTDTYADSAPISKLELSSEQPLYLSWRHRYLSTLLSCP